MSHPKASAFLQPVDAEELGLIDYYEKIKVNRLSLLLLLLGLAFPWNIGAYGSRNCAFTSGFRALQVSARCSVGFIHLRKKHLI